jgi:hypothetical protein
MIRRVSPGWLALAVGLWDDDVSSTPVRPAPPRRSSPRHTAGTTHGRAIQPGGGRGCLEPLSLNWFAGGPSPRWWG